MSAVPNFPALPDPDGSVGAVSALAEGLTNLIDVAHALVEAGRDIDLAGLDSEIGLLCAKALDLPPDEGRRVRPRLIALSGSVAALSQALAARAPSAG